MQLSRFIFIRKQSVCEMYFDETGLWEWLEFIIVFIVFSSFFFFVCVDDDNDALQQPA